MEGTISNSNPSNTRIAVVTGGNKGIGLEVCQQLASNRVTVVLTARDEKRGAVAVEKLKEQGLSDVIFHQLDIADSSSIARLTDFLKTRFGRLDILVNNAAISGVERIEDPSFGPNPSGEQFSGMDREERIGWMWKNSRETYDAAKQGIQTNYYGTKNVIEALLPLLQSSSDGRIVNVSSNFGLLSYFRSEELKQELNDVDNLTEERLDGLLDTLIPKGLGRWRAGSARVAEGVLFVQGGQSGHERILEDPSVAAPRATYQLCASRIRQDRHDQKLRASNSRRGGKQRGEDCTASYRWDNWRILCDGSGGVFSVIFTWHIPFPYIHIT